MKYGWVFLKKNAEPPPPGTCKHKHTLTFIIFLSLSLLTLFYRISFYFQSNSIKYLTLSFIEYTSELLATT